VSNFITNLARRGAGLPLAAECCPSPAPTFESSFEASEGLSEITTEEIVDSHVEALPMSSLQTMNTSSAPEVQRSPLEQAAPTAKPKLASTQDTTRVLQPSVSREEIVASTEIVGKSETEVPRAKGIIARPIEVGRRDSEFKPREESAPSQVAISAPGLSPAAGNPPAKALRRPQKQESAWSQSSVKEVHESTANRIELVAMDRQIRPAPAEPTFGLEFLRIVSASPTPPAPELPIQVRIGRVEVQGTPSVPEPTRATPKESPPLGFASYHRLRRYRD
jgi:hypothetical protein